MIIRLFIWIFLLSAICRTGASAQNSSTGVAELINKLPCSTFEWVPWKDVSEKGAMKVPIKFGGRIYWFQLDTGADVTLIYGKPDSSVGWKEGQNSVRVTDVELGGMKFPARRFMVFPDMKPGETSGTVGLDVFMGNIAVIDYPGKRFCLMPRVDAPDELFNRKQSVNAVIRDGKFFIEATLNGQKLDGLFFDTGSSAMPLSVDYEEWKSVTGLTGESQAAKKFAGWGWGKPVTFIGGESTGELEIGSMKFGRQLAFYRSEPLDFFKKFPFQTIGNIGNAPFFDKIVVMDLSPHAAFRILK